MSSTPEPRPVTESEHYGIREAVKYGLTDRAHNLARNARERGATAVSIGESAGVSEATIRRWIK
jgi:hypothetical protein